MKEHNAPRNYLLIKSMSWTHMMSCRDMIKMTRY